MQTVLVERKTRTLPPLILHPFADASGPGKLVESSRASLMLQGLLPTGEFTAEQLESRLLDGRYCEIRMLFYVGKDLIRWVEQCLELAARHPELHSHRYTARTFISYLVFKTPAPVQAKLRKWGVADYRSIFARAIALNSLFADVPGRQTLSDEFVRNYHRYTDAMFKMNQEGPMAELEGVGFDFDLYASGEYSRLLERQWAQDTGQP